MNSSDKYEHKTQKKSENLKVKNGQREERVRVRVVQSLGSPAVLSGQINRSSPASWQAQQGQQADQADG